MGWIAFFLIESLFLSKGRGVRTGDIRFVLHIMIEELKQTTLGNFSRRWPHIISALELLKDGTP